MYKLSRHVPATTRRFALITQRGEGPCSLVLMCGERQYSSQQPPNKKKSHKLLWTFGTATLLTGATVLYAQNSRDFRDWLGENAPPVDNFVAIVLQERGTIGDWAITKYNNATRSVSEAMFGKEGTIVEKPKSAADTPPKFEQKEYNLPAPALAPIYVEEKTVEKPEVPPAKVIVADPIEPKKTHKIPVTKDIVELENLVRESVKTAIDNYNHAAEVCVEYTRQLNKIVESSVESLDKKKFDGIKQSSKERATATKTAVAADKEAEEYIRELTSQLNSGEVAPAEAVQATRRQISKFKSDLAVAREQFRKQEEGTCLADKYWSRVETARKSYMEELEAMFPGVDLSANKLSLESGDPDLLLMHTLRQVVYLQQQLAESSVVRDAALKRAIQSHDQKDLIEAKVDELVKKAKMELEKDYQKKALLLKAESEQKQKEELKKQIELHQDHLKDKLEAKENEVKARFDAMVNEAVEKEKVKFAEELVTLRAKLKAIEDNVQARTRAEAQSRRAQSLWAAGESLLATTKTDGVIDKAVKAVEKAGGDDELVKTVVKGIPQEVRENGTCTENELRDRYLKMEKTALRVALVSKDGAPLPVYLLSYLQSLLLFSRVGDIPKSELDNQPTDFSQMDAFDILQRARYWIDRNDIASALRYVNLLQGASRTVASGWREAAVRYLEVRQAAETVMAHASASAMQNS